MRTWQMMMLGAWIFYARSIDGPLARVLYWMFLITAFLMMFVEPYINFHITQWLEAK